MKHYIKIKAAEQAREYYNLALTYFNKWQPPVHCVGQEMETPFSMNPRLFQKNVTLLESKITALLALCETDPKRAKRDFGTGSSAESYARLAAKTLAEA